MAPNSERTGADVPPPHQRRTLRTVWVQPPGLVRQPKEARLHRHAGGPDPKIDQRTSQGAQADGRRKAVPPDQPHVTGAWHQVRPRQVLPPAAGARPVGQAAQIPPGHHQLEPSVPQIPQHCEGLGAGPRGAVVGQRYHLSAHRARVRLPVAGHRCLFEEDRRVVPVAQPCQCRGIEGPAHGR